MPRRNRHQNLDFEIHVDPSCLNEPTNENLPTMELEDVVGANEVVVEEGDSHVDNNDSILDTEAVKESVEVDIDENSHDSVLDTEDLQPTVEEVSDDPGDDSVLHSNVWAEDDNTESRRESAISDASDGDIKRWPSMRTEALIHAAARDIVAHVATRPRDSIQSAASVPEDVPEEDETSFVSESYAESHRQSYGGESEAGQSHVSEDDDAQHTATADDGGDSSSHHEHEDDVFSDNSPRSSMGSVSEAEHKQALRNISPPRTRSARISDIPHSDADEDFVPTIRGTPRPPFRSPSSVKAMQMSSPPASVIGTPRSSRRTPRPTVSRLGSPSVSAQYSPKKTPPRFKRNTPPLVLLHVTVLPSRWAWGHVMDSAQPSELSPEGKTLWEYWNQLQDRTGDTISDRGILLPHPQNDYEVLEERLLETLELPLRRRARILECGHYLGPSNEKSLPEEIESEGEDDGYYDVNRSPRQSMMEQTHWCTTCRSDIRYDSLGEGKIYRVKVYASNGLMRAGAWEACWKEMERVDVELEPIVDSKLQEELNHLAAEQERALEMEEEAAAAEAAAVDEEIRRHEAAAAAAAAELAEQADRSYIPEPMETSPQPEEPEVPVASSPPYDDDRQARDEERLREIYGASPPSQPESSTAPLPRQSDFVAQETPASPSVEAFERREGRREAQKETYKSASLPELVLQAVKVLMQDQKNVLIGLLSLLVLVLAFRSGTSQEDVGFQAIVPEPVAQIAVNKPEPVSETRHTQQSVVVDTLLSKVEPTSGTMEFNPAPVMTEAVDPCLSCSKALEAAELSLMYVPTSTVEVVKTVTETMVETVTVEALPVETVKSVADVEQEIGTVVEPEAVLLDSVQPKTVQPEVEVAVENGAVEMEGMV